MPSSRPGDLAEPLLPGEASDASADAGSSGGLGDMLGRLVAWVVSVLASFGLCARPARALTPRQRARLASLARGASVAYDASDPTHESQLRELWRLTFPARPLPGVRCEEWKEMGWQGVDPATDFRSGGLMSLQNLAWFAKHQPKVYKRLLSKSDGVRSEWEYPFAAAGVNVTFALVDLLELGREGERVVPGAGVVARKKTKNAATSAAKGEEGSRDAASYGATDGKVRDAAGEEEEAFVPAPSTPAGRAFADLLERDDRLADDEKAPEDAASVPGGSSPTSTAARDGASESESESGSGSGSSSRDEEASRGAFGGVYVAFFEALDREWLETKATYMEFSSVMAATKAKTEKALERAGRRWGGCTLTGLREELGLQ
jgi:hypothetical protein